MDAVEARRLAAGLVRCGGVRAPEPAAQEGAMRRGALGVRLCDRAACPHRWPCAVHGTASVGDYEHLGRHAGSFKFDMYIDVLDVTSCSACGFALCCCEAAVPPEPAECRECGARAGLVHFAEGTVWGCGDANTCHERMAARRRAAAAPRCEVCGGTREPDGVCRPSDPCWDHDFKPQQLSPALRPGWTTDDDGCFLNDAIALMVCPTDDGEKWQVLGNGGPWTSEWSMSFVLAEHAMQCAEQLAREYLGEAQP